MNLKKWESILTAKMSSNCILFLIKMSYLSSHELQKHWQISLLFFSVGLIV